MKLDDAALGWNDAGDGAHEGALASSVGTDDSGELGVWQRKGDITKDFVSPEGDTKRLDVDRRGCGSAGVLSGKGGHWGQILRVE